MPAKTKIAWTENVWNPVTGCSKRSRGCEHCYAEVMARRLKGMGLEKYKNGFEVTLHPEELDKPKQVKKPTMFFVCSMGDLFHTHVPFEFIDQVMETIKSCPQHTFQILTKRAERMYRYFETHEVPKNAWLGVSVETIDYSERALYLAKIPNVTVRFLSCEPLLGPLDELPLDNIDWVICGGESGQQARPVCKEWVFRLKSDCDKADVPFFFKQWGTWGEDGVKRNVKENGCLIDGREYKAWPKITMENEK